MAGPLLSETPRPIRNRSFTTGSKGPFSQPFPVGTTSRWFQNPIRLSQCFSSPPMLPTILPWFSQWKPCSLPMASISSRACTQPLPKGVSSVPGRETLSMRTSRLMSSTMAFLCSSSHAPAFSYNSLSMPVPSQSVVFCFPCPAILPRYISSSHFITFSSSLQVRAREIFPVAYGH